MAFFSVDRDLKEVRVATVFDEPGGFALTVNKFEAIPVAKIKAIDSEELLGWLYLWNDGELSPLWTKTVSQRFRLEISFPKNGNVYLTKQSIERILSWEIKDT